MILFAYIRLTAIHRGDDGTIQEHRFGDRKPEPFAAAGRYQASGSFIQGTHLAGVERIPDDVDRSMVRILAIHFSNDPVDFVVRITERFDDQANIVTAF